MPVWRPCKTNAPGPEAGVDPESDGGGAVAHRMTSWRPISLGAVTWGSDEKDRVQPQQHVSHARPPRAILNRPLHQLLYSLDCISSLPC